MPVLPLPDFDQTLEALGGTLDPAELSECHGIACGQLCCRPAATANDFMRLLASLEMVEPGTVREPPLERLFEATASQLDDEQYGFELLLPQDSEALELRTLSLAHWCSGFLAALGGAGGPVFQSCSEEVSEALADLEQIARAEISGEEDEAEETAMAEIIEYLRVVTLMIREELRPAEPRDALH